MPFSTGCDRLSDQRAELATLEGDLTLEPPAGLDIEAAEEAWRHYVADKAELTRQNYERDLRAFAEFVGQPDAMSALAFWFRQGPAGGNKVIHGYKAHLLDVRLESGRPYAPATIRRRIYALKAVLRQARIYQIVTWDVDIMLPDPEPQRQTRGPGPDGYAAVLEALDRGIEAARADGDDQKLEIALRDRVMIRLLHDSGLRRTETTGIEWPVGVRLGREPSVLVLGKGKRRHDWLAISTRCRDQIEEYVAVRGKRPGYLLCAVGRKSKKRLNKSTVNRRVNHWAEVAGVHFTPHGLRHTATTTALDQERGDKRVVRRWSRHRAEASLDAYDDRRRQDDRRIAEILSDPGTAEPHS